jgi:peptidoglycan/LPS O-acetylase OafA/YrhL
MGAIRLFLACGIAFAHIGAMVLLPFGLVGQQVWFSNFTGGRPVIFFYVVSGFLISYVLDEKYGPDLRGTLAFYRARFLRIYPLWWAVMAICMVMTGQYLGPGHLALATILLGTDWLVPFWTYPDAYWLMLPSPLGIAWTLAAELTFYLIAPFVLRSTAIAIALLAVCAAIRVAVDDFLPPPQPLHLIWGYFFFPATMGFFILGHLARRVCARYPIGDIASVALLAASVLLSLARRSPSVDGLIPHLSVIVFALALPGVFKLTKDNRAFNFLGDLTYPLYLTHTLTIVILFSLGQTGWIGRWLLDAATPLGSPILQGALVTCGVLAFALAVAAVTHLVIEIPARAAVSRLMSLRWRKVQADSTLGPSRR